MKYLVLLLLFLPRINLADEVVIREVKVTHLFDQIYQFDVTLKHADQGWEHYADAWQILSVEGKSLGVRVLMHPHINEQPFTRSLSIKIPKEIHEVEIRAHDKLHGYGSILKRVTLPKPVDDA